MNHPPPLTFLPSSSPGPYLPHLQSPHLPSPLTPPQPETPAPGLGRRRPPIHMGPRHPLHRLLRRPGLVLVVAARARAIR